MTAQAELKKENTEIQPAEAPHKTPVPVNASEDLFERFGKLTENIAERAYAFFRDRGGEFGNPLDDWFKAENEVLRPVPVELTETDNLLTVKAAVAGFKPDEIEVSVKNNMLVINGISIASAENKDGDTILREWNSNRFCRRIELPSNVAVKDVSAEIQDGMLKVSLPKAPTAEAKKITVKSA